MRKNDLAFNLLLIPVDFILLISAALAAYLIRISPVVAQFRPVMFYLPLRQYVGLSAVVGGAVVLIFALSGLYSIRRSTPIASEVARAAIAISAGIALAIAFMFFSRELFDSRFILLAAWGFATVFVIVGRMVMRGVRRGLAAKRGFGTEHVVILGTGDKSKVIKKQIRTGKNLGLRLIKILEEPDAEAIEKLHKKNRVDRVLATETGFSRKKIMQTVSFCEEHGIEFSYIPDMFGAIVADMSFDLLEGIPVVSVRPSPLDGWGRVAKRLVDIIGAFVALVLFVPVFAVVAIAIKWDTDGPVFVKLKRVSRGKEFNLYKFRSMVKNAQEIKKELQHLNERKDGPLFKVANDPRITKVGRFLRAHRLDELPQLFNVLKGEMSLVGPRPHEIPEIEQYKDYHKKVLALKAGITGMAQVSGAHDLPFEEEVKLDRFYIENWSLRKDFMILAKTAKILLFDKTGV